MEELKKKWFQMVWTGLVLCSVAMNYIIRYADAAWAQSHAMQVVNDVIGWIVLPMTVILFVLHCVENWRIGERYFWRKWRRWGSSIFWGVLLAAVLLVLIRFFKSGGVFVSALPDKELRLFLLILFSFGGLLYMIAKYKFNNPNKD